MQIYLNYKGIGHDLIHRQRKMSLCLEIKSPTQAIVIDFIDTNYLKFIDLRDSKWFLLYSRGSGFKHEIN